MLLFVSPPPNQTLSDELAARPAQIVVRRRYAAGAVAVNGTSGWNGMFDA